MSISCGARRRSSAPAREAGVARIVKCSAYQAAVDGETANLRSHGVIERELERSGVGCTVVRPHGFMQTFTLLGWDMMQSSGVISFPAGDGAIPLVDVRDVGALVAKVLTESGHEGKVYDVTGPEALTFARQAEIRSQVLERQITYLPGREPEVSMMLSLMGVTATPREHAIKVARMIREHRLARVHPTLSELGITPTTFERFVRDVVDERTDGGNSFQPPGDPVGPRDRPHDAFRASRACPLAPDEGPMSYDAVQTNSAFLVYWRSTPTRAEVHALARVRRTRSQAPRIR